MAVLISIDRLHYRILKQHEQTVAETKGTGYDKPCMTGLSGAELIR